MDYYSQNAKEELERRKVEAEALAEAWSLVKRQYKKNGEAFANLGQNFTGATIKPAPYSASGEKEIAVYIAYKNGRSYSASENIAKTVYSGSEEAEAYKKERRLIERGPYLHPYIMINVDEIEELCKNKADFYKTYAEGLGQALADFDKTAARLVELREEAKKLCKSYGSAGYVLESIFEEKRA